MTKNTDSTRYYSSKQEHKVAKALDVQITANSGANKWRKGDLQDPSASLLIECKTVTSEKNSFSIKSEWIEKNRIEGFANRLDNSCIAFSFGPDLPNYYVIDEKLMKFLIEKLREDYENLV